MSRGTPEVRIATTDYYCTALRGCRILKGDTFLYSAVPLDNRKGWHVHRVCLGCAERSGWHTADTRRQLEAKR